MTTKKRSIVSFHNLPEEIQNLFREKYGNSYGDFVQKVTKPNNDIIYVVPLETDDTYYMIKVEVRVDAKMTDDEFDKQLAEIESHGSGESDDSSTEGSEKENEHDNGDGFNPNKKEYEIFSGGSMEDLEREEEEEEENEEEEGEDDDEL